MAWPRRICVVQQEFVIVVVRTVLRISVGSMAVQVAGTSGWRREITPTPFLPLTVTAPVASPQHTASTVAPSTLELPFTPAMASLHNWGSAPHNTVVSAGGLGLLLGYYSSSSASSSSLSPTAFCYFTSSLFLFPTLASFVQRAVTRYADKTNDYLYPQLCSFTSSLRKC
jgi:hypothetical protein